MQDGTKYRKAFAEQVRRIHEDLGLDYQAQYRGEGPMPGDHSEKQDFDIFTITFRAVASGEVFSTPFYSGLGNRIYEQSAAEWAKKKDSGPAPPRGTLMRGEYEKECLVPVPPLPFSVLSSLKMDDPHGDSFEDWCAEYAYDTDSRRALELYLTCQRQTQAFKRAFPNVDLDTYEPLEDY